MLRLCELILWCEADCTLPAARSQLADVIEVVQGTIESIDLPEKVSSHEHEQTGDNVFSLQSCLK